jgi:hypothetical protein
LFHCVCGAPIEKLSQCCASEDPRIAAAIAIALRVKTYYRKHVEQKKKDSKMGQNGKICKKKTYMKKK